MDSSSVCEKTWIEYGGEKLKKITFENF